MKNTTLQRYTEEKHDSTSVKLSRESTEEKFGSTSAFGVRLRLFSSQNTKENHGSISVQLPREDTQENNGSSVVISALEKD